MELSIDGAQIGIAIHSGANANSDELETDALSPSSIIDVDRIATNYLSVTANPLEAGSEIASQTIDQCKSTMGAEGIGLTVSDKYVIDNHMYADSSWSDSPGEELVDFGDDRFVDNELSDADASVSWVPKTGDSSDSDWEPCDEFIMKKPNTHFKEPNEYAYRKEKLEEYGIDDINDDHVGVTPILDNKKRKQRRKRTNILRS